MYPVSHVSMQYQRHMRYRAHCDAEAKLSMYARYYRDRLTFDVRHLVPYIQFDHKGLFCEESRRLIQGTILARVLSGRLIRSRAICSSPLACISLV